MATCIFIYLANGKPVPAAEFNLPDFGGQLPNIGDTIVPHADRTGVSERVWDVVARYLEPGVPFDAQACIRIVVNERELTPLERLLFERPPPPAPPIPDTSGAAA